MFLGQFYHSIDSKGRVIMPSKYRNGLLDGVIVSKAPDGCLAVFVKSAWPAIQENLKKLSAEHDSRMVLRNLNASASEESIDKQGRLNIPQILRTYAGLTDEVVITGAGNHIEIWAKAKWDEYQSKADPAYSDIGIGYSELGF